MEKPSIVAHIVAVIDIVLAIYVIIYIATLFSQDVTDIIPGSLSYTEKVTRLVVYGIFQFSCIFTQLAMGIKLLLSAQKMIEDPARAKRTFKWWGEWSVIYLLVLILDAAIILLLMEFSRRKLMSLGTVCAQIMFRLVGLVLISHSKIRLEDETSKV